MSSVTYGCRGDDYGREEGSLDRAQSTLQPPLCKHTVPGFNDVIAERQKEIALLGDLKVRGYFTFERAEATPYMYQMCIVESPKDVHTLSLLEPYQSHISHGLFSQTPSTGWASY